MDDEGAADEEEAVVAVVVVVVVVRGCVPSLMKKRNKYRNNPMEAINAMAEYCHIAGVVPPPPP